MSDRRQIGFIGGGAMAEAMIAGIVNGGIDIDISVVDVVPERLQQLSEKYGVQPWNSVSQLATSKELLVVAVKPQQFGEVADEIKGKLDASHTVVSIMAGVTVADLRVALAHDAIVRVMPNTPAQIGKGATAWTATDAVDDDVRQLVAQILDGIGMQIYFDDEKLVDVATALSASGPAYVFVFLESLADAAVQLGMPAADARRLAVAMVQGSAELAAVRDVHLSELRNLVTSPGGTTAAALKALEAGGFRNCTMDAVLEAYKRGTELSGSP